MEKEETVALKSILLKTLNSALVDKIMDEFEARLKEMEGANQLYAYTSVQFTDSERIRDFIILMEGKRFYEEDYGELDAREVDRLANLYGLSREKFHRAVDGKMVEEYRFVVMDKDKYKLLRPFKPIQKEIYYAEKNRQFFDSRWKPIMTEVYNRVKDIETCDQDYEEVNMKEYKFFLKSVGVEMVAYKNNGKVKYIHKIVDPVKYDFGDGGLPDVSKGLPKKYWKEEICPF